MRKVIRSEYYWFAIFAFCFLLFEYLSSEIRPNYAGNDPLIIYFLGIAPNLLPAVGIPALFVLFIISLTKPGNNNKWLRQYKFITAVSISTAGLIIWEFIQLSGKLTFDWNDILWSIIGGWVFLLIWHLTPLKFKGNGKQENQ